MEKQYDKLVRDRIPEIITNQGNIPVTRKLTDHEYILYLNKKLKEEVDEYLEHNCIEELCDIAEVINAITAAMHQSDEAFEEIKEQKRRSNGAFQDRILLKKIIIKE
jgi:Uncharacterized conserved protein